jgi:hypothetical protein
MSSRSCCSNGLFPGQYRLVASRVTWQDGRQTDLHLSNALGRTQYNDDGTMWVLLTPLDRHCINNDLAATVDEYRQLLQGVIAYYGRYSVDETTRTVTHCIEAALNPEWVGKTLLRSFVFSGDSLALTITGRARVVETVYERMDATEAMLDVR